MKKNSYFKTAYCVLCAFLTISLLACGKKGLPIPQDSQQNFALESTSISMSEQGMISLLARLSGAYDNAERFILELEPESEETCTDCPFRPLERVELVPAAKKANEKGADYSFSYQVQSGAKKFRWRFIVQNRYKGYPHAVSKPANVYRDDILF